MHVLLYMCGSAALLCAACDMILFTTDGREIWCGSHFVSGWYLETHNFYHNQYSQAVMKENFEVDFRVIFLAAILHDL